MHEFVVRFHSLKDVQDFVSTASRQPLRLTVGNDRFSVNATSFMGIFTLNCRNPLRVTVECSQEEFDSLLTTFDRFLVT